VSWNGMGGWRCAPVRDGIGPEATFPIAPESRASWELGGILTDRNSFIGSIDGLPTYSRGKELAQDS
jgi:hypothetical protein